MNEFNENPFKKDTPVQPFSNGTDFMCWASENCDGCIKIDRTKIDNENQGCELESHLALGTISGTIPLWVAKEIGCTYDPLYQVVDLFGRCRKFSDNNDNPF